MIFLFLSNFGLLGFFWLGASDTQNSYALGTLPKTSSPVGVTRVDFTLIHSVVCLESCLNPGFKVCTLSDSIENLCHKKPKWKSGFACH